MNFDRKNIQHSTKYRSRNCAYKTSNIMVGIDPGLAPGIMPKFLKETALGIALGLELGIVFGKRLT